ncbi:MAG: HDOD domain-containing protein [Candidatus Hydrogenedentota bacterium]|nr:MAG: HDOD domain-containing protein [Candidatus Hydrogenedentota bacterium]
MVFGFVPAIIRIQDLPPMPQVVSKILQLDENNVELSSDQLQALVSVDPALTAKIMKMANSAFFARSRKVSTLSQAITLLGFRTIKSLTLLVSASDLYNAKKAKKKIRKELWMRSVLAALTARVLAEKAGKNHIREDCFVTGLMKNVGRLIMLLHAPDAYADIYSHSENGYKEDTLHTLEEKVFGITSPEVSRMALQEWNFPEVVIQSTYTSFKTPIESPEDMNPIHLLTILAERYVFFKNLTGTFDLPEPEKEKLLALFVHDARTLNFSHEIFEFILTDLYKQIKEDDFYHFTSEIFSL